MTEKKMPEQNEPVSVDIGVMVMIPLTRWNNLKDVEADKERYAQHIIDHQANVSRLEVELNTLKESKSKNTEVTLEQFNALEQERGELSTKFNNLEIKYNELLASSTLGTATVKKGSNKSDKISGKAETPATKPKKRKR